MTMQSGCEPLSGARTRMAKWFCEEGQARGWDGPPTAHAFLLVVEVPAVESGDALLNLHRVGPAQRVQLGDVRQLAHGAVRLRGVEEQRSREARRLDHKLGQRANRQLFARADVDVAVSHLGAFAAQVVEVHLVHDVDAGVRHVFAPEEFAQGPAAAPELESVGVDPEASEDFVDLGQR